jgi:putative aldouronate transport system substrate-binding protein
LRKIILLCTCFMTIGSAALVGCTNDNGGNGEQVGDKDLKSEELVTPAGTFPIAKEKVTLKVLVKGNARVENFETNTFTKWLEEKTNVHIQWEVAPENNYQEKLNLVLASGDYPDVIMDMEVSPAQQMIYGNQGVFLKLNSYIDKYGTEIKKIFEQIPQVKETISDPKGNIYALPQVAECYHCTYGQRMWIYKPWLDKLGLKVPETTDEFYQVLKAFKEKDPNGNGKADEIPLAGSKTTIPIDSFLMNSFIYTNHYNKNDYLMLNNGKVDVVFNKPEWKEGLKYLNKLFKEGLLAPQTFTQDKNGLKQMAENPNLPLLGAAPAFGVTDFTQIEGKSGRWAEYVAVPPLKGPSGYQVAAYDPYNAARIGRFIITRASKYPEIALRWADSMYMEEITLRSVDGRPDQEWRWAKDGEKGIDGRPAVWAKIQPFGAVTNEAWAQTGLAFRSSRIRLGLAVFKTPELEVILHNESKNKYEPYKQDLKMTVPPLFFSNEQASEIADLQKTINDYVQEMIARFTTGDMDIDKGWDGYVQNLNNMNLKRYLQIVQEAYDAKNKH